ncbi:hypothetical protein JZ785_04255 [Alicyclobacillus curvatus]|nr:hypothetical protein JZ785_04255 [Alicyclobacillus curvatus]
MEPEKVDQIAASVSSAAGVLKVNDVKARWFGHEVLAEASITVHSDLSVNDGHQIGKNVIHRLPHNIEHLSTVQVHIDPVEEQGKSFHAHESFHEHHGYDHDHNHKPEHRYSQVHP